MRVGGTEKDERVTAKEVCEISWQMCRKIKKKKVYIKETSRQSLDLKRGGRLGLEEKNLSPSNFFSEIFFFSLQKENILIILLKKEITSKLENDLFMFYFLILFKK